MYAHVTNGEVDQTGQVPPVVFTDGRWWDLRTLDLTTLAQVGWFPVTEVVRPVDTDEETWTLTYQVGAGTVTQVWVARAWTAEEAEARSRDQAQITDLQARVESLEAYVFKVSPPDPDGVAWTGQAWPPGAVVTHDGHTWINQSGAWLNGNYLPGDPLHPFWSQQPDALPTPWIVGMHLTPGLFVSNGGHVYQWAGADTASAPANWAPVGTVSTAAWTFVS